MGREYAKLMTFEDTLASWLVKQRWFAGKGRTVHDLAVLADTEIIPGDPGLPAGHRQPVHLHPPHHRRHHDPRPGSEPASSWRTR